jgi:hypothetical protein
MKLEFSISCFPGRHSTTWAILTTLFYEGFFEIESPELFALADFELQSSWFLPPE